MSLEPREGRNLDYVKVFDVGCVKTRLKELTQGYISKLAHDDVLKEADKARRAFKPIPTFQQILPKDKNIEQVYGVKARKLAEKVLEQERQNYVDARAERDKRLIVEIIRKLRYLVWTVDEKGEPQKLKLVVEKVPTDSGAISFRDIQYVGERDFDRLHQIVMLKNRLGQLKEFVPYYSEEIKKLYDEARELGDLEYFYKEKKEKKAKT